MTRRKKKIRGRADRKIPVCGLCGSTKNLTRTECCNNWICDDEHEYVAFSYARNSCYRNHARYTLCGIHFAEGHKGSWQDCAQCREDIEPEMYVWYGTNEFNFEKLANPPAYEPTKCHQCGRVIVLSGGGYSTQGEHYFCDSCTVEELGGVMDRLDIGQEKNRALRIWKENPDDDNELDDPVDRVKS